MHILPLLYFGRYCYILWCSYTTVRQRDSTTVRQCDSETVRQYDSTTMRQYDSMIVRQYMYDNTMTLTSHHKKYIYSIYIENNSWAILYDELLNATV